jgi:ribonuclease HII
VLSTSNTDTPSIPLVAGVDEAGRGPLAGPVVTAAVILGKITTPIKNLRDSKKLSQCQREQCFAVIKKTALCYSVAYATVEEIDHLNILQATMLAMQRVVIALGVKPTRVLIDGNRIPKGLTVPTEAVVGGDDQVDAIAAASIIAKVLRDRYCLMMDKCYPIYGFARHKGYGTPFHLSTLRQYGASPFHRRSFAPVAHCIL